MGNTRENTINERQWWPIAVHIKRSAEMLKNNELHKAIPTFEKRFAELEAQVEALSDAVKQLKKAPKPAKEEKNGEDTDPEA